MHTSRKTERRNRRLAATAAALTALGSIAASALGAPPAPGSLDRTFGDGGYALTAVGTWFAAAAAAVTPAGKIVTAGEAQVDGRPVLVSTRMLRNGQPDEGYGHRGVVIVGIGSAAGGTSLALQRDGKIVIAGTGKRGTALGFAAIRLRQDGALDRRFGRRGIFTVDIGAEAIANSVSILPGGAIVIGGTAVVGHNEFAAVKLHPNGTLDRSFGSRGVTRLAPVGGAWGMVVQPDGKIVLGGQVQAPSTGNLVKDLIQSLSGAQSYMVARLLTNGRPDPTFGTQGVVQIPIGEQAIADAVALQPDGKLLVTGNAFTSTGVAATVRLLPTGSLDPAFGSGGIATQPLWQAINAITLQRDGRIVLGGTGASAVRLNPDGTPDTTFGAGGVVTATLGTRADAANGVAIQTGDGKIVLAGCAVVGNRIELSVIRLQR